MVFLESEMDWNVLTPPEQLTNQGLLLRKSIYVRLLEDFANKKASKDHGFFVAITKVNSIGAGKVREITGDVLFPVNFTCLTLKPAIGEVLVGKVDKILKHGIFIKSGPIENIFISDKSIGDFKYVGGENPVFLSEKNLKIEKGISVRFKLITFRWLEADRSFQCLATIAGDFLGPI